MPPQHPRPLQWSLSLFCLALLATAMVYWPGLSGEFQFDDQPNIIDNPAVALDTLSWSTLREASFSGMGVSSRVGRPLSMLSFALNHYASGFDPFVFKATNLAIHLTNGLLVYALVLVIAPFLLGSNVRDTRVENFSAALALMVSVTWLLHPLNLTSVLYVVQRMTSLSALFVLCGVLAYAVARRRMVAGRSASALLLLVPLCAALAFLAKENGILLPGYILILELFVFRFRCQRPEHTRILKGFAAALVAVPLITALAYLTLWPESILGGYAKRPFSLNERLLTEARAVVFYLRLILAPDLSAMGLYHDDFGLSRSLLDPVATLLAIIGLIALLIAALAVSSRFPAFPLALGWFLVGHSLESTIVPLELLHEHRNYLPSLGPLLLGCTALLAAIQRLDWSYKAVAGSALIACIVLGGMTWIRAGYWANSLTLTAVTAANHPRSARAHYDMGRLYAGMAVAHPDDAIEYRANAKEHFEISASLDPHRAAPLFGLIRLNSAHGVSIDDSVALVAQRLEHRVPQPGTAGWFSNLLNCQSKRVCHIDDQTIADLFQAALRNPKLPNSFRAALLIKASQFMYNHVGDGNMALRLARDAVEASPQRIVYKISLINLYLALDLRSDARELLEAASKQDRLARFRRELDAQWERLGIGELPRSGALTDAS